MAASVCKYDERKSVCSFFALLCLTTYGTCSCCCHFHLVCKIVFFLLCRRASCQNGCKWKLKKRTASSSPGVSSVQACSPHCASIWHQLFGRSPSKHFAVSCSSFSAANFNQFKLSLQQQRQQQLGKEHVAPTAVTLCLPLPVAICQLEIIKGCPAANAVFFPPPLQPPLP